MSILVDGSTRVVIQGMTGKRGRVVTESLLAYGTRVVAGVVPFRREGAYLGIPEFDSVADAVEQTGANASLILVPPDRGGSDAVLEALQAGIGLAVYSADPVPIRDAYLLKLAFASTQCVMLGPNTPGLISPGKCKLGFMPSQFYTLGPVGIASRSGSLSYEVARRLTSAGIGQSTVVGVGGDPIKGFDFREALIRFEADPETEVMLVLGEIGGTDEYQVCELLESRAIRKPVVALIAGESAPPGRKMGHAGALIGRNIEGYQPKVQALRRAGASVVLHIADLPSTIRMQLK